MYLPHTKRLTSLLAGEELNFLLLQPALLMVISPSGDLLPERGIDPFSIKH